MAYEDFVDRIIATSEAGNRTYRINADGTVTVVDHDIEKMKGQEVRPGDYAYASIRDAIAKMTNGLLPANQLNDNRIYADTGGKNPFIYIGNSDGTVDWVRGNTKNRSVSPDNAVKGISSGKAYDEIIKQNFGSRAQLQQQSQPAVSQGDLNKVLGPVGGEAAKTAEGVEDVVTEEPVDQRLISDRERELLKLFRQARRGEISERAAAALRGGMVASGIAVEGREKVDTDKVKRDYIDAIVDLQGKMQELQTAEGDRAIKIQQDLLKTIATVVNARMAASGTVSAAKVKTLGTQIKDLGRAREKLDEEFSMTAADDKGLMGKYGRDIQRNILPGGDIADKQATIDSIEALLGESTLKDKVRIVQQFERDTGQKLPDFLAETMREMGVQTPPEKYARIFGYMNDIDTQLIKQSEEYQNLLAQGNDLAEDIAALGVGEGGQLARLYASLLGKKPADAAVQSPEVAAELEDASTALRDQIEKFNKALEEDPTGVSSAKIKEAIMGTSEFEAFKEAVDPTGLQDPDTLFNQYRGQVRRLGRAQEKAADTRRATRELEREKLAEKGIEPRGQALRKLFFPKKAKPAATAEGIEQVAEAEEGAPTVEVAAQEAVVETPPTPAPASTTPEAEPTNIESPTPRADVGMTSASGAERRAEQAEKRKEELRRIASNVRKRVAAIVTGDQPAPGAPSGLLQ